VPGEGEGLPYDTQLVFDKNTGTYKSIGKTLDARAQEQVEKLPPKWQPAARTVTTTLLHTIKKSALASMITEDVINAASKYMKSAQDYLAAQYARQATRLQHELKIDKILQQFDKLPENLKGTGKSSVNEYIHDSTRQGLWGYYPDARLVGTSMAQIDPEFKRRFNAFPDAAQKLIKAVFEQGHDSLAAKQKAVADAIDREYADRIAAVQGDAELTEKFEKEKSLRLAREAKLLGLNSSKPYAYLGRYGDYVVVGKSALQALGMVKGKSDGSEAAISYINRQGESTLLGYYQSADATTGKHHSHTGRLGIWNDKIYSFTLAASTNQLPDDCGSIKRFGQH
jgi:hypothetical protein